ncbi:MAG: TonB family protein [Bacteroidales bacterium]|nr:TonB family protein [Bacteroidales bacterium]
MNAIFLYLLKAALINALMLGFYHFAIRPGRNFKLMRAVLVLAIVLPLFLPLIPQPMLYRDNAAIPLYVFSLPETSTAVVIAPEENQWLIPMLQNSLYLGVTSILLLGLLISVISVIRKYLKTYRLSTPYGKVLIDNTTNSPYSFFRWVFFSEDGLLHPAANWLLKHEFSHVKHGHSFDRLLSGLFRSFFWFSPFAHFNNRLLSEVHEYQADADAIEEFGDRTTYSNLIVTFAGLHNQQPLTNPFSAHLKKRMIMLNYLKPGKLSIVRLLSGITIIMAVTLLSSMIRPDKPENISKNEHSFYKNTLLLNNPVAHTSQENISDHNKPEKSGTIPPAFPGGDEARIAFFSNNISYPTIAREKNIHGTVLFRIIIEKDGKVTNPSIEKGIGGGCDEEVLRVVKMMPDWNPGTVDGEPVKVEMILPVSFSLTDNKAGTIEDGKYSFHRIPEEEIVDKPVMQNDPAKKKPSTTNEVFTVVENPPQFPGGEDARVAYMQKAITYPEQAKRDKIEGTVYVTFVIEKDGQVSNSKVLRGIGGGCDEVALKAIQQMPPWIPGKQRGEAVRVQFNMPVSFKLGAKEKATVYTQPATDTNQEVFTVVEVAPQFPGGADAQQKFMIQNISYPAEAKSKGIQGTVYVNFIVEKDGSVSNAKVLRGVATSLDTEALRVINSMPRWTPGTQRGEPVRVSFNIPIKFSLGEKKTGK